MIQIVFFFRPLPDNHRRASTGEDEPTHKNFPNADHCHFSLHLVAMVEFGPRRRPGLEDVLPISSTSSVWSPDRTLQLKCLHLHRLPVPPQLDRNCRRCKPSLPILSFAHLAVVPYNDSAQGEMVPDGKAILFACLVSLHLCIPHQFSPLARLTLYTFAAAIRYRCEGTWFPAFRCILVHYEWWFDSSQFVT